MGELYRKIPGGTFSQENTCYEITTVSHLLVTLMLWLTGVYKFAAENHVNKSIQCRAAVKMIHVVGGKVNAWLWTVTVGERFSKLRHEGVHQLVMCRKTLVGESDRDEDILRQVSTQLGFMCPLGGDTSHQ